MNSGIDLIREYTPLLLQGAAMTLKVLFLSMILSFCLGGIFGILMCSRLKIPFVSSLVEAITFVLRGVPFFVQLLIVYYVLPDLLNCNIGLLPASVLALGICSSGYVAQLVRGAINAIPASQWEASFVLGFSTLKNLRYVILPQMFPILLPSLNNEIEAVLKSTAVISSIGMLELTRMGMNIVSRELAPVPIYLAIAAIYLCMSAVLGFFSRKIEKKFAYVKH